MAFVSELKMPVYQLLLAVMATASTVNAACSRTYSDYGHVLKRHVVTSFIADNPSHCYERCKSVQGCQSMNYYITSRKCELNDRMNTKFKEDYHAEQSAFYMSIIDAACETRTLSSGCCVFPFNYTDGITYHSCTTANNYGEHWCSLTPDYIKDHSDCSVRTKSHACCVFPLVYLGKAYHACITENNNGKPWCALTSNYSKDRRWDNCA